MLGVAETMLRVAQKNDVHLALLMDISAACGSQVIYDGPRSRVVTKRGKESVLRS